MVTKKPTTETVSRKRYDPPHLDPNSLWDALSRTPGIGVSITDGAGRLLFVNDTSMVLFSNATGIDYHGKHISDFHPKEYVDERLSMIARVIAEGKPLSLRHIYNGRGIQSTLWPIRDRTPPFHRVIVVTRLNNNDDLLPNLEKTCEQASTQYIDLGPLNVLTRRELEVMVLLGHGLSVPKTAALLYRSPKTIQRHKASVSEKLKVHSQAELVAIVTAMGLQVSDAKLKRFRKRTEMKM